MSLLIKKEGILTTVQDLGRDGFQRLGINPNGVMDRTAARLINLILGNDQHEAVLEMHFPGGEILFEKDMVFALGGAAFDAVLAEKPIENWRSNSTQNGDVLKFTKKLTGNRTYLAVKGGFKLEKWLGSASTNMTANIGGFNGRKLRKGDRIHFNIESTSKQESLTPGVSNSLIPVYSRFPTVRFIAGAEFELLTALSQQVLLNEDFVISNDSNRMGFRLQGEALYPLYAKELISSAVTFGTIQLFPDGQVIILMADHQTSGGYPRIANVIGKDLPVFAQLGPGDKVAFQLISLEAAEQITLEFENDINLLKTGLALGRYR